MISRVVKMRNKKKVLIAYESKDNAMNIGKVLRDMDYEVVMTGSGMEAEIIVQSHCPDIVLLGVALEIKDGISVLRSIRKWSGMPVIVFSSSINESYMLDALDSGADDYIEKPFSTAQLLSRMKVAMRHYITANNFRGSAERYRIGDLEIDCDERRVFVSGRDAELTKNEFRIVLLLAKHRGSVCTYDYVMAQLWGPNSFDNNEILRVNMAKIRKKLNDPASHPRYILTISGVGYRMAEG